LTTGGDISPPSVNALCVIVIELDDDEEEETDDLRRPTAWCRERIRSDRRPDHLLSYARAGS
jgi:hypothetical protein